MKLQRLVIRNFRGITHLELDLDNLVVLIGENNVGKTAVLHALRLCLRDVRAGGRTAFEPFDFHLKDSGAEPSAAAPISIAVTFAEESAGTWDAPRLRRLRDILHVSATGLTCVTLRVTCQYDLGERDFSQSWEFLDGQGNPLPSRSEGSLRALQREVAFYLLEALRDAGRNFDAKGPFWRAFLKDGQLTAEKKAEIEQRLKELNDSVVGAHHSFDRARIRLQDIDSVVKMSGADAVGIEAVPGRVFDLLAKAQVHLSTTTGAKVPVGRHGEGMQSLAVMMLFSAFLDLEAATAASGRTPLVALEEPEAHLHPSAIRVLWRTLDKIPGQKLLSTHSGDLLSQIPIAAVRRLARTPNGVVAYSLKQGTLDPREERLFNFHVRHARGELLFARCWILVEGETEVTLLQELARHLGIDMERAGVRCVAHRAANIELFIKVAKDFGIRWCALTDNDTQGQDDQARVRAHTPTGTAATLHVMGEADIESHLCASGFGGVYERYLTPQTRRSVTAAPGQPGYWQQVLQAIGKRRGFSKPAAAMDVMREIQQGTAPVPPLLETVVRDAVALAGGV